MTRPKRARTTIAKAGHARAIELRLDVAKQLLEARRDAGLSVRQLASAAGVGGATVAEIESADRDPGVEVLARIAAALGGRLRLWIEPGTGVAIHDRHQAAMVGALTRALDRSWTSTLEVGVNQPVRGVIDLVLERPAPPVVVAVESESGLRRIEQQVRWARAKAEALAAARRVDGDERVVSQLLLLRSTAANRAVVATFRDVLSVAYPACMDTALAALTGRAPWPGPAIVWCVSDGSGARLLSEPPRGVDLGR